MKIYQLARFEVRPAGLDECKEAIVEFVESAKMHEPGTLRCVSFHEEENPNQVIHPLFYFQRSARASGSLELHGGKPLPGYSLAWLDRTAGVNRL